MYFNYSKGCVIIQEENEIFWDIFLYFEENPWKQYRKSKTAGKRKGIPCHNLNL